MAIFAVVFIRYLLIAPTCCFVTPTVRNVLGTSFFVAVVGYSLWDFVCDFT